MSGLFVFGGKKSVKTKACKNPARTKNAGNKARIGGKQDGRSSGGKESNKNSLAGRMGSGNCIALSGTRAARRTEARGLVNTTP